jgi:hypothetical protein
MATLHKSELDIALERLTPQWLAGFFDGEGCVTTVRHHGTMPSLVANITQAEQNILTLIAMKFGGRCYLRKVKGAKKGNWCVQYGGRSALPLLQFIQPHVILKRKLVDWGIALAKLHGTRGPLDDRPDRIGSGPRSMTPKLRAAREELFDSIRSENKAGRIVQ